MMCLDRLLYPTHVTTHYYRITTSLDISSPWLHITSIRYLWYTSDITDQVILNIPTISERKGPIHLALSIMLYLNSHCLAMDNLASVHTGTPDFRAKLISMKDISMISTYGGVICHYLYILPSNEFCQPHQCMIKN